MEIPVDKEIATPAKIKEWKHLRSKSNVIVQKDVVQVGLLISTKCMKALEPTKIIHNEGGGPYTYKTWLGWFVVGPINCISKRITRSCNPVAVTSSKLASHHLGINKSVKDVSLEEMFQAMYQHDFSESELVGTGTMLKCGEVSPENKKFMKIVETGTSKKDGHYDFPLKFQDSKLMLLNNKKQAIQRLMGLKRRFMKDSKFFEDYLRFMDNL